MRESILLLTECCCSVCLIKMQVCVHVLSVYSSLQSCVGREGSALAPLADAAQPGCRKSEGKKKREAVVGSRMRIETVSPAALGIAGFRYLYSVCFFKLFGPTGL